MHASTLFVVAALVRRGENLLLIEQKGPEDEATSWMLPGGRVEYGETLIAALARELAEETGLRMTGSPRMAFAVDIANLNGGGYSAITYECEADGDLRPQDPDGLIVSAAWVPGAVAVERLRCIEWYDCEPLVRYLAGGATAGAVYLQERP